MPDRPDPDKTVPWTKADLARLAAATQPDEPTTTAGRALLEAILDSDHHAYTHGVEMILAIEREAVANFLSDPATVAALELGAAWRRAEAALPEGWHVHTLHLIRRPDGPDIWQAVGGDRGRYQASGEGPTPTAALLALAEKLGG